MKMTASPFQHQSIRMCGLAAALAIAGASLWAQSPAVRIRSEVNVAALSPIPGSLHPLARAQNDAGRLPADTRLNGITIYFNRSAAQEADLDALLAAQQTPSSPLFHQWLTPDQFADRFGMAQPDIDTVETWLQQQGFAIDSISRSRNAVRFSGTVRQIESAFGTEMHYYNVAGQKHFAPSTVLSVPAAIAPVVSAIGNLNDFRPRPQHVVSHRNFTSAQSGNVYFAPGDIVTTYDMQPLLSASVNGSGQAVAVMGQSTLGANDSVADIEAFQSAAGLAKKDPTLVLMPGTGDSAVSPGDQAESDLDVEWSSAMAPGAAEFFVYTGSSNNFNVWDATQYSIDNLIAPIISISYSACELDVDTSFLTTAEGWFKQAAAQGQTVIAASGDEGSTACYGDTSQSATQQETLQVNYPASSAYVTAIGGTEINMQTDGSGNSTYWQSASGTDVTNSAKTYIPEISWNDDAPNCGQADCLAASGGGPSTLVSQPTWQTSYFTATGEANPKSSARLVPDIAFYASPGAPGYLFCTSDTTDWGSGQTASCNNGFRDNATGDLTVAGGTSFGTPIFAGMVAILNQKASFVTGSGLINPTLYSLAANAGTYSTAFHDVTSGNNDCNAGSANCSGSQGYSAGTGYDMVTGLGSVDLAVLAAAWPVNSGASASLIGTTTAVVAGNSAPNVNANDTFTITVTSDTGGTTPGGNVTLQIDGGTQFGGTTVSNQSLSGNGTISYTTSFATTGIHQVLAQYAGDATHAASTGVAQVSIAVTTSGKGTFAMAGSNLTESRGSSGASTITVTPSGGYTGTVDLQLTNTSNNNALQNLCFNFADTINQTTGEGAVTVPSTAPVTTTLTLDSNAADCSGAAVPGSKGLRALRTVLPAGSLHTANNAAGSGERNGMPPLPAGLAFAGLVLVGFLGRKSRWLRNTACALALGVAGLALSACNSSVTTTGASDPPKGTYTMTISGTDSVTNTITTTTTFTFVID